MKYYTKRREIFYLQQLTTSLFILLGPNSLLETLFQASTLDSGSEPVPLRLPESARFAFALWNRRRRNPLELFRNCRVWLLLRLRLIGGFDHRGFRFL